MDCWSSTLALLRFPPLLLRTLSTGTCVGPAGQCLRLAWKNLVAFGTSYGGAFVVECCLDEYVPSCWGIWADTILLSIPMNVFGKAAGPLTRALSRFRGHGMTWRE